MSAVRTGESCMTTVVVSLKKKRKQIFFYSHPSSLQMMDRYIWFSNLLIKEVVTTNAESA